MEATQARESLPLHVLQAVWKADAQQHLSFFLEYTSRGMWQPAAHHLLLCEKLEAVERGELKRLMVYLPPRHGKSEIVSRGFPAWFLGRNPDKEIIGASYSADLAFDFSRRARNTFREWAPKLFGLNLSPDSSAQERWELAGHRGGYTAAGVGGPITGRGAHVAVIDDPIKNQEEAGSAVIRSRIWDWYRTTLRTRLAPGGAVVLVMTRWHDADLAGMLLEEMASGGESWDVVCLPALAESNDLLGRDPGEPLWPERGFDTEWSVDTKRAVGSTAWAALYQQRPTPEEGGLLKRAWWRYWDTLPDSFDQVVTSWDMAFKGEEAVTQADYVVGEVWGRRGADIYLIDLVRDRMDMVQTLSAVRRLASKWPDARPILIEDKANGPAIVSMLRRELGAILPVNPEGGKLARTQAVAPYIEAGNVHLPQPSRCPWVTDFTEECAAFPSGANDDQVDSMTQALIRLTGRNGAGGHFLPGGFPGRNKRRGADDDDDDSRGELNFFSR